VFDHEQDSDPAEIAHEGSNGAPEAHHSASVVHPSSPAPEPELAALAVRFLLEEVELPLASFKNILAIKFAVSTTEIRVDYRLHPLSCEVGLLSAAGGLRIDSGYLCATPAPADPVNLTVLKVTKTMNFRDLMPRDPGAEVDAGKIMS
jgi:hypothetical protein